MLSRSIHHHKTFFKAALSSSLDTPIVAGTELFTGLSTKPSMRASSSDLDRLLRLGQSRVWWQLFLPPPATSCAPQMSQPTYQARPFPADGFFGTKGDGSK